jgi:hypothetical protein
MFGLTKKNNPKVTFFTEVEGLIESSPIVPLISHVPDWFKSMKSNLDLTSSTIKRCPSFIDFFKKGYVVNMWCDLYLNVKNTKEGGIEFQWKTPDIQFTFEMHSHEQFLEHTPTHIQEKIKFILKTVCPWNVKTEKGYSLYQMPMTYSYNSFFEVLPGIVHSDIYHTINQQVCIMKEGEYIIKKGTPLAVYVPFKREDFDLEMKMMDKKLKHSSMVEKRCIKSKFKNRFNNYKKSLGVN